jgi:hypothetical protein
MHGVPLSSLKFAAPAQAALAVLNWIAPCTVKANMQKMQASFLGNTLTGNQHLAVILMPMFSHKKSMLWITETTVMRLLGDNKVSFDLSFQMKFASHSDTRDERPLSYNGRLAAAPSSKLHKGLYHQSMIVKENQTLPATHEVALNMVTVEDRWDRLWQQRVPCSSLGPDSAH